MSKIVKLHKVHQKEVKNSIITEHEESIIDGTKGLTFKVFDRKGDDKEKYLGKSNNDGTFDLIHIKNEEKNKMDKLSTQELLKELKKIKSLKFVVDYLETLKQKGGVLSCPRYPNCPHSKCPYVEITKDLKKTEKNMMKSTKKPVKRNLSRGSKRKTSRGSKRRTSRGSKRRK